MLLEGAQTVLASTEGIGHGTGFQITALDVEGSIFYWRAFRLKATYALIGHILLHLRERPPNICVLLSVHELVS